MITLLFLLAQYLIISVVAIVLGYFALLFVAALFTEIVGILLPKRSNKKLN